MNQQSSQGILIFIGIAIAAVVVLAGCPQYKVWLAEKRGEAELGRASWNRQIKIEEANAVYESSIKLANADVERAKGIAEANRIIGASLKNNNAYLRWLWIDKINENPNSVIYIPTESNMPILEAGRLVPKPIKPEPDGDDQEE